MPQLSRGHSLARERVRYTWTTYSVTALRIIWWSAPALEQGVSASTLRTLASNAEVRTYIHNIVHMCIMQHVYTVCVLVSCMCMCMHKCLCIIRILIHTYAHIRTSPTVCSYRVMVIAYMYVHVHGCTTHSLTHSLTHSHTHTYGTYEQNLIALMVK